MNTMTTKRRKTLRGILLGCLLGLLSVGCSQEQSSGKPEQPVEPAKVQAVTFEVRTGLETYSVPSQTYEKKINSLQAIVFDARGTVAFLSVPKAVPGMTDKYALEIPETGSFSMLLVANHLFTIDKLYGKSLSEVSEMIVSSDPGKPDHFVMSTKKPSSFTISPYEISDAGTLTLTRLSARIDIQTTLDKLALKSVTVKNRKTASRLLESTDTKSMSAGEKKYTSFTVFGKASADGNASLGQIYAYENSASGNDGSGDGTSLVIETTYGGRAVRPITIPMPAMKRNYIYSLQIVMDKSEYDPTPDQPEPDPDKLKLTFNLEVLDWFTGETFVISPEDLYKQFKEQEEGYRYTLLPITRQNPMPADG